MRLVSAIVASCLLVSAPAARAERPVTTYINIDSSMGEIADPTTHGDTRLIFLNRCAGGCTISPGFEDSRTNRSSIIGSTINMPPYPYGDASWNAVVACVINMFEPFDLEITDVDPGSTPHFEAIVSGRPQDAGFGSDTGGVAPATCGVIGNSMNYTFAEVWGDNPQAICQVIAQETGHTFGMDHEFLCEDPMTYLNGCGAKTFQDVNAQCGEYEARGCNCGGSTQNSVQRLLSVFGASLPSPPSVAITEPVANSTVKSGFIVRVNATDNNRVEEVRLRVNGQDSGTLMTEPYIFNTPAGLADGTVSIEARARDNRGDWGTTTINVTLDNSCGGDGDCSNGFICVGGECQPKPPGEGQLGELCVNGDDCQSASCGQLGDERRCTEPCDPAGSDCPDGFDCKAAGDSGACWPGDEEEPGGGGGGCAVGARAAGGGGLGLVWLLTAAAVLRRRRR